MARLSKAAEIAAVINKQLGTDAVKLGSDPIFRVTSLPTGVLPIDVLLDGGLPRNRITEFFGAFSTLKSWIALCAIAEAQKRNLDCAVIDTEHSFDPAWAAS